MSDEQNDTIEVEVEAESDEVALYTCSPTKSLKFGRFEFKNGLLKLDDPDDIVEFEEALQDASMGIKSVVKKISLEAANRIAKQHTQSPEAIRGTQTTASMKVAQQIAKDEDKRVTESPQPEPAPNPSPPATPETAPQNESGNQGGAGEGNNGGGIGPLNLKK